MSDEIILTGLRAFAHHGVFEHERRDGQEFVIDATAYLDLAPAAAGDALERTVHYGVLAERIVAAVERDPVDLIETVATRVAELVLAQPGVHRARVTVHKPGAPIAVPFADVAVTIDRSRQGTAAELPAVLALGANLGDRRASLAAALDELGAEPGVRLVAVSQAVETPALKPHGVDLDAPAYLNAVALVRTSLAPAALLALCQRIELAHGRTRTEHWGDRTLDIDIVAIDGLVLDEPGLVVPHPRAHERAFVLAPWLEVEPDAVIPGRGRVDALLAATGERVTAAGALR
ncbi:MAG: 2-amino-4-hydroxy-6-hydroxymethyldihydropteridine diphosphokinase [Microbacteriaceae bacterium]